MIGTKATRRWDSLDINDVVIASLARFCAEFEVAGAAEKKRVLLAMAAQAREFAAALDVQL